MASRAIACVTHPATHGPEFVSVAEVLREFWPDFRRGGMAEWSMAVVLKTGQIAYDIAVIFCAVAPASGLQYLAIIASF